MVGCIDCNRWTRDGWLYIHLAEEDLAALRADRGPKTIAEFLELQTGWTMLRDDGWYAYYNGEKPLGPFATEAGSGASEKKRPQEARPGAASKIKIAGYRGLRFSSRNQAATPQKDV